MRAIFGEKAREVRDTSLRVPHGEYGIIVSNPNNVDEKMVIVSAFAIDGGAAAKE